MEPKATGQCQHNQEKRRKRRGIVVMQVAADEVQTSEALLGDPWAGIERTGEAHCAM